MRTKTLARGQWLKLRSETLTAPGGPGGPGGPRGAPGAPRGSGSSENVCKSAQIRSIWDHFGAQGARGPDFWKKQKTGWAKNNAQDSETKFTRLISTENQGGILL